MKNIDYSDSNDPKMIIDPVIVDDLLNEQNEQLDMAIDDCEQYEPFRRLRGGGVEIRAKNINII